MGNAQDDLALYARKLGELAALTAGASHALRDPLNAIVLHLALLRQKLTRAAPEMLRHVEVLERETDRMHRKIQALLRFQRLSEPSFAAVDLDRLLEEASGAVVDRLRASGILLRHDRSGPLEVRGDCALLREAFEALLHNACDAMAAGGTLLVSARSVPGGGAVVTIEDNGVGIAASALPRIFDLYYSTKQDGDGLGLSIAFRVAQLHGGAIAVVSTEGEGSRFEVSLPPS